jgi:hypothetical protein
VSGSIHPAIETILRKLEALPASPGAGRALSLCEPGENLATGALDNPEHILRILLRDLELVLTPEMLQEVPPVSIEQYCLQTVLMNDSGAALLARLVTAFVTAYADESTNDQALQILDRLEKIAGTD